VPAGSKRRKHFIPETGGADRIIRRWNARSGEPMETMTVGGPEDPLAAYAGDPGAQVFRACVACHTPAAGGILSIYSFCFGGGSCCSRSRR
jgi:mono/diheme cytochrome c family protein